jgi:hypothetical protein
MDVQLMKDFYNKIRPLFKSLKQSQLEGIERLLKATRSLPLTHRAYLLATVFHEIATTMQPITEYGGVRYFDKYDTGNLAKNLGNTPEKDGDGYRFRGRGDVMITGYANYKKMSDLIGVDLVGDPDKALDPEISATILVKGCTLGKFTKYKLSDFLNEGKTDYIGARKVVNGTDKNKLIASYAIVFEEALKTIPVEPVNKTGGFLKTLITFLVKIFGRKNANG